MNVKTYKAVIAPLLRAGITEADAYKLRRKMLTRKEIEIFADFAADRWSDRANATAYYGAAQKDVKENGWRVTRRVRDILWSRLREIQDSAEG